ncbi:MAG: glutamine-hydrolyzing carbamoyl-phosphate synthase small subunit [Clostridia bacterium]|nr:glutamine-hydrolyzing carbamoyl-phosphate synthase small subunit [Clostridia bacterium]
MKGYLVLEDGALFTGRAFGATGETLGEVVFNTGMTGYQEILTDPSYCGQIVTMTYPLIGNYGINEEDFESKKPFVRGFVVREHCPKPSNWRSQNTLDDYLKDMRIMGLSGVDTRALTRRLRNTGAMKGMLTTNEEEAAQLVAKVQTSPGVFGPELVKQVTTPEVYHLPGDGPRVVVLDFGAKENIIRSLKSYDCDLTVVPASTTFQEILSLNPQGIMLSNGPGDPTDVPYAIETVAQLVGKIPIFGICLGHQIIGLALGGRTYKLKFGHRGSNHPVQDIRTGRVYITAQNHGFAIDKESLEGKDVEITHINLNDGTVEGIRHRKLPVFSVQYHPEAAPGPEDSEYLFGEFLASMGLRSGVRC